MELKSWMGIPINPYISDKLAIGLYRWALDDCRREIREGFPLLRRIKDRALVFHVLPAIESIPQDDREILASALVKRFHLRAVRLLGEEDMTREEAELYQRYDGARRHSMFNVNKIFDINEWNPEELELNRQMRDESQRFKLNRRRFAALIKETLRPVLGDDIKSFGGTWQHWTQVGKLTVFTSVDVAGRHHQLTYEHGIAPREHPELALGGDSILSWMGISGQTMWNFLTEADTMEAAQTLALLCSHFLEALRKLVSD